MMRLFAIAVFVLPLLSGCTSYRTASYKGMGSYFSSGRQTGHSSFSNGGPSLMWPVQQVRITQAFSPPKNPKHNGIDLGGPKGSNILAAHSGRVIYAGRGFRGYGKMVMIESEGGWASLYAHMNHITVKQGQHVDAGDQVGGMGRTGRATGVHLHFELMRNKVPVDPLNYLPNLNMVAGGNSKSQNKKSEKLN